MMGAFHHRCRQRYGCKTVPFVRSWKDGKAMYIMVITLAAGVPA